MRDFVAISEAARERATAFDVRTPSIDIPASTLSGGNQQKVVVARAVSRDIKLLIASQPTRGLDVGSIEYIHERMVAQRDRGVAVLVVSPELDEVIALVDGSGDVPRPDRRYGRVRGRRAREIGR